MTYNTFREFVRMKSPRVLDDGDDDWVQRYWQEKWIDPTMDWWQHLDPELWMLRVNLGLF